MTAGDLWGTEHVYDRKDGGIPGVDYAVDYALHSKGSVPQFGRAWDIILNISRKEEVVKKCGESRLTRNERR